MKNAKGNVIITKSGMACQMKRQKDKELKDEKEKSRNEQCKFKDTHMEKQILLSYAFAGNRLFNHFQIHTYVRFADCIQKL